MWYRKATKAEQNAQKADYNMAQVLHAQPASLQAQCLKVALPKIKLGMCGDAPGTEELRHRPTKPTATAPLPSQPPCADQEPQLQLHHNNLDSSPARPYHAGAVPKPISKLGRPLSSTITSIHVDDATSESKTLGRVEYCPVTRTIKPLDVCEAVGNLLHS